MNKGLVETAQHQGADPEDIGTVLLLKRAEVCETAKTVEGRRVRKNQAISVVEEDLGVANKSLQQVRQRQSNCSITTELAPTATSAPLNHCKYQPKPKLVLEHYNHNNNSTYSLIMPSSSLPMEIHVSNYTCSSNTINDQYHVLPELSVGVHSEEQRLMAANASPRPPTSSTSAANLLLLLSKMQ